MEGWTRKTPELAAQTHRPGVCRPQRDDDEAPTRRWTSRFALWPKVGELVARGRPGMLGLDQKRVPRTAAAPFLVRWEGSRAVITLIKQPTNAVRSMWRLRCTYACDMERLDELDSSDTHDDEGRQWRLELAVVRTSRRVLPEGLIVTDICSGGMAVIGPALAGVYTEGDERRFAGSPEADRYGTRRANSRGHRGGAAAGPARPAEELGARQRRSGRGAGSHGAWSRTGGKRRGGAVCPSAEERSSARRAQVRAPGSQTSRRWASRPRPRSRPPTLRQAPSSHPRRRRRGRRLGRGVPPPPCQHQMCW